MNNESEFTRESGKKEGEGTEEAKTYNHCVAWRVYATTRGLALQKLTASGGQVGSRKEGEGVESGKPVEPGQGREGVEDDRAEISRLGDSSAVK